MRTVFHDAWSPGPWLLALLAAAPLTLVSAELPVGELVAQAFDYNVAQFTLYRNVGWPSE